jgi:hypothetical protein
VLLMLRGMCVLLANRRNRVFLLLIGVKRDRYESQTNPSSGDGSAYNIIITGLFAECNRVIQGDSG